MTTSQTTILSKPKDREQISIEALAYMRARAKRHAYDLVMSEFKKSGISKAELARRLFGNKGADRVSRMLGGPGNWTLKTVSDLLFATSGAEPTFGISYPLEKPRRNFSGYSKYLAHVDQTYSDPLQGTVQIEEIEKTQPGAVFFSPDEAEVFPINVASAQIQANK